MANQKQLEILKKGVKFWNNWRKDNPAVKVDLSTVDFRTANFSEVNFKNADLRAVDLGEANLTTAILVKADLRSALLPSADLTGANLAGANLTGANLTRANLSVAILDETNLTNSELGYAVFAKNDLSTSIGLEAVWHSFPPIIDTQTIRNSKGKIPIEFLRGCGLSDLDIEYTKLADPSLDSEQVTQITYEIHRLYCDQPIQFYSCFISYNSQDQDFAQRLHDNLQNNGVRCWFAPEDMKIGDEFRKTIGSQIRLRDKLLVILSENSIQSEWVGDEVEKALSEEKELGALKLFPIRLDDAVIKSRDDWAEKIRLRRHIGDFSRDYDKAFARLLRDLKAQ